MKDKDQTPGFGAKAQAANQVRDAVAGGVLATEAFNRFGFLQAVHRSS